MTYYTVLVSASIRGRKTDKLLRRLVFIVSEQIKQTEGQDTKTK